MADPLARRPRRDLCLPRWLCSARTPRRKGRQRAGAGRRRRPVRRAQASARPRTVRGRVVLGMERLPRRSRRTRVASAAVGDHRVNEAVVATYLAGGNTRRIRGALQTLLKPQRPLSDAIAVAPSYFIALVRARP